MCDAKNVIERLKEIIKNAEEGEGICRERASPKYDRASISSSCTSVSNSRPKVNLTTHYNTPVPSCGACGKADIARQSSEVSQGPRYEVSQGQSYQGPIPGCYRYEIRCKQTLDGNNAKPTVMCAADQLNSLYPPQYFGCETGEYKPLNSRAGCLDIDLDQLDCGMINGFCPPSRYEQFMAGKGGLPLGHPDSKRPEKFHHPFGMGRN